MHSRIIVETLDQGEQLLLGDVGRQDVLERFHPDLDRAAVLVADVNLAGRIVADQDHGQAGRHMVVVADLAHVLGERVAQAGREGIAVNDLGFAHDVFIHSSSRRRRSSGSPLR